MISSAKKQVSLLPTENDPSSISSVIINWLTSVGRVVIIFTELIVVSAFASRFWLDRINADLSETVRQQKAILDSTDQFQADFNLLKTRLDAIGSLRQTKNISEAIQTLLKSTPVSIRYRNLQIDTRSDNLATDLRLVAYDTQTIVDFVTNLILNPNIDNVIIGNINRTPKSSFYDLSVKISFKKDFVASNEI